MKPYRSNLLVLLFTLLLSACVGTDEQPTSVTLPPTYTPVSATTLPTSSPLTTDIPIITPTTDKEEINIQWWNDAVFYEVFVRSFQDSNGDGVGDLKGLIERLDYLQELGVTALWLMPIMQSSSYHGYDVEDYYRVDEEYGTNEDFLLLMEEAHRREMRVIIDLVINHTSRQHPWFQASLDSASEQREWYVWEDEEPDKPNWHEAESDYYYGYFWGGMPDLNFTHPPVSEAIYEVTRFWLEEMKVDGFRMDAIKFLIESDTLVENTPETHAWLKEWHRFYKELAPEALAVGEIWSTTEIVKSYVPDEMDMAFEFDLAEAMITTAQTGQKAHIERAMRRTLDSFPPGQFATFLANHDQTRTRSRLLNDEQAKLAATILLTSPGVPFIYYGEEIGMEGDKPDENLRRPMQWTDEEGGGFTTDSVWHPIFEDYQERNVRLQENAPDSILNHYRALIRLRHEHQALRTGEWQLVESSEKKIYAFLRYEENEVLLVLLNLHKDAYTDYTLALEAGRLTDITQADLVLGEGEPVVPSVNAEGGFGAYQPLSTLPGYSSFVIRFGR